MDLKDIVLEKFSLDRTEELFDVVEGNRDYLRRYLPWVDDNTTMEHSEDFIKKTLDKIRNKETEVAYFIIYQNKLIGVIDTHHIDQKNKSFHVGYWLVEEMQGKGIMTHVTDVVVNEMFSIGYEIAELRCATINPKSCAVAQRLGFERKEILKDESRLNGELIDMEVWIKKNKSEI